MASRRLILISGPIASGKTSAARGLAACARAGAVVAAAIDMDDMIEAVAGDDWSKITSADRRRACRATASFVQACFESGVELIAVAGSTLSPYEWDEVTRRLDPSPETLYVLLRVTVEESVRRTQSDPERRLTRDPAHVMRLAEAIEWSAVRNHDVVIDTDGATPEDVLTLIATKVLLPLPSQGEGARG